MRQALSDSMMKPEWVVLSERAYEIVFRRAAEVPEGDPIIGKYQSTVRPHVRTAAGRPRTSNR